MTNHGPRPAVFAAEIGGRAARYSVEDGQRVVWLTQISYGRGGCGHVVLVPSRAECAAAGFARGRIVAYADAGGKCPACQSKAPAPTRRGSAAPAGPAGPRIRQNVPTGLTCPKCGRDLLLMTRRKDGRSFIACRGFYGADACDYTSNLIPEHLKAKRDGVPMLPLPGFETPAPPAPPVAPPAAAAPAPDPPDPDPPAEPAGVVLDAAAGQRGKDAGMARAEAGAAAADAAWSDRMVEAVFRAASELDEFICDDVWRRASDDDQAVREKRAFGPVMARAAALGYCKKTDRMRLTAQASRNRAPVSVWRSLLWRPS